jgi:hypothetical protein
MNPYWLIVAFTLVTQLCVFFRWLHRRLRDAAIERAFIRDVALNHLPHIYHALHRIAAGHGVELEDPPPVRFLELNGKPEKADARGLHGL